MFANPSLYVLIDSVDYLSDPAAPALNHLIDQLICAGVEWIQLRDKRLDDRQLLTVARMLVDRVRDQPSTFLIVNDRVDIAILSDAAGVHLGQEDLSIEDARQLLPVGKVIGVSTHSLQQAVQAANSGADYIGIGPVFPSGTKCFGSFIDLELVAAVAQRVKCPVYAIGGIDLENVDQIVAQGVRRIAVGGAVTTQTESEAAARCLLTSLNQGL